MKLKTIVITCLMLLSILPDTSYADERTAARKELWTFAGETKLFDSYSQTTKRKAVFLETEQRTICAKVMRRFRKLFRLTIRS